MIDLIRRSELQGAEDTCLKVSDPGRIDRQIITELLTWLINIGLTFFDEHSSFKQAQRPVLPTPVA